MFCQEQVFFQNQSFSKRTGLLLLLLQHDMPAEVLPLQHRHKEEERILHQSLLALSGKDVYALKQSSLTLWQPEMGKQLL